MWNGEDEEDNVGSRQLQKQRCLDIDWNNPKEITAVEIVYCIRTYGLSIEKVPAKRLRAVTNELLKLQKQDEKARELARENELINKQLAIYRNIDEGIRCSEPEGGPVDEPTGRYHLDPDLFQTHKEAEVAMNELWDCFNHEMTKIYEYGHRYKNSNTYNRDIKRLEASISKDKEQYIKLGGSAKVFDEILNQLPKPELSTLKYDVDTNRKNIKQRFIAIGTSPTRADEIAIAITTETLNLLK